MTQWQGLLTPTQGREENIGFHHIHNSLDEVGASSHESVCDSGSGPKKYPNAIMLLEKYWGLLSAKKVITILPQAISPNQVPGTDSLAKAPVQPSLKALIFSRPLVPLCHQTANIFATLTWGSYWIPQVVTHAQRAILLAKG